MIANAAPGGLTIDLLLSGYRLFGVSYQVNATVRLGDLLNSGFETLTIQHASILSLKGQVMATLPEVSIEKHHLIAAIPKETEEYQQKVKLARAGMAKPDLVRTPVLALCPPYAAMGKAHVPRHSDISAPDRGGLSRFFPLTDAVLFMGEERLYQGPIAFLNRDVLAVLGKTGEEDRPMAIDGSADLDEMISRLNRAADYAIAPDSRSVTTSAAE